MPKQVCMGAMMQCTFGATPSALAVLPKNKTFTQMVPDANIMDHIPMVNIMPFGVCASLLNPTTAAATTAAFGVLTPTPCVPNTPGPWAPGAANVLLGMFPTLDDTSKLMCAYGGVISFINAGEMTVDVP